MKSCNNRGFDLIESSCSNKDDDVVISEVVEMANEWSLDILESVAAIAT